MSFITSAGGKGIRGRVFGPVITYPALQHSATVIMLHGLGDTGNGWAPVASELGLPHVKWIFPTAPTRPVTVNMGMSMPAWFDIDSLDQSSLMRMVQGEHSFDPEGTEESLSFVEKLIEEEIDAGIPENRIVVGGFSQGGHIALKSLWGLGQQRKLAGLLALSTWIEPQKGQLSSHMLDMPIFYGHGGADPLIPPPVAQASVSFLQSHGVKDLRFKLYPGMQHSACPEEFNDIKRFLEELIPEKRTTEQDIDAMSIKELKSFLQAKGVSTSGLLEKHELLSKAKSML